MTIRVLRMTLAAAVLGCAAVVCVVVGAIAAAPQQGTATPLSPEQAQALAREILSATGVKGGLVVHIGCGTGRLTAALRANERYLVHGIDADATNIGKAREYIRSLGLYGPVSVERWTLPALPYVDNLVNLVVAEDLGDIPMGEVMRVLAPGGVAYVKAGRGWKKTSKPWPKNIDEWTHALHDATNNAVANDTVVGPPHHIQWVGSPRWARSHDHLASVSVAVSSGGRIFYIVDEAPTVTVALPSRWFLVARDAFSGTLLWEREMGPWEWHLRGFRSGPSELQRRLVAAGERVFVTLGYGAPVTALDAATGKTLLTYRGTEGTDEIVYADGVLYLAVGDPQAQRQATARRSPTVPPPKKKVMAVDANSGRVLWERSDGDTVGLMPLTLAVGGGRVYFQNTKAIVCLGAKHGQLLWRARRPVSLNRPAWSAPTLVVYGDVVLSADRGQAEQTGGQASSGAVSWTVTSKGGDAPVGELIAFSAKTGRRLWSCPCRECYNAPVDVLVADGLVWTGNLVRARDPGITTARDPLTGEVKRQRPPDSQFFNVGMGHHRCYRNKATSRYLVLGRAGVEFVDVRTGRAVANHWVRGVCQYGVLPCNGLLYAPPHSCACYITAKLNGFNALAPAGSRATFNGEPWPAERLERGPAYGSATQPAASAQDWPTYRHDAARSGWTKSAVPAQVSLRWATKLGGRLTSVTVAEGRVFVAAVDRHTVYSLDANSGKVVWKFTAGGRVDSPPTIYNGLCLFGSADGWVYCLRATDGELVWRFRAAPQDLRIVAYDQVESVWPVHGSVLVEEGVVFCAAGRSSFLDGGMYLYRLEAATGKLLSVTPISGRDPKTGEEPQEIIKGTNMAAMNAALPDVLSSDGQFVYMRHVKFDKQGRLQPEGGVHLFGSTGFLDDSWWHRTYWVYDTMFSSGWGGWPQLGTRVPAGRILVLDESTIYGYGRNRYSRDGSHVGLGKTAYRLFATSKSAQAPPAARRRGVIREKPAIGYKWTKTIPLLVRAMVLAGDKLFIAGPPDFLAQGERGILALEGKLGASLWAVSPESGEKLSEVKLPAPPVFDSLVAANGRLYLCAADGSVLSFGGG